MSEQAKPVGASDKMKAKDFITLGIFTVLFFAVVMVCIFASAATVVTFAIWERHCCNSWRYYLYADAR